MKKLGLILLILVVMAGAVALFKGSQEETEQIQEINQALNLGGDNIGIHTHIGAVDYYRALPFSLVEGNATTTDAENATQQLANGGSTINQLYSMQSVDEVLLNINAKGGTASSSIIIKPMFSLDSVNWYTKQSTTTPEDIGTTTPTLLPFTLSVDPGTSSSTKELSFFPPIANFMRLLIMGEDLTTDPDDGVKAFIQVGLEQTY